MFVSEDNTHDAAAVNKFVKLATEHLTKVRGLTIEAQIQLTDGCAAQYKSKVPFTDISFCKKDLGCLVERHFYGSRHGKGPSDGAGAVLKSAVRRVVMGRNIVVNNSKDLFEFAQQKMAKEDENHKEHFKRTVFHVTDIDHNRPERCEQFKTLKGTRQVQAVQAVDKMLIKTRNLSCFCEGCIGDAPACVSRDYVGEWQLHDIHRVDEGRRPAADEGRRPAAA
jgi:hypothetical protein